MSPDFNITIAGANPTALLKARMLSLKVHTSTGKKADSVEMTLDDRGNALAIPARGAVITLQIGYLGQSLVNAGQYTVDETGIKGGAGDTITISGKSADMRDGLKTTKNRSFHATTLGQVVAQIASDNGLTPQVHPDLAPIVIDHRDQTGESDMHFATRLAADHGAIVAPKGGRLIVVPRGAGFSASGGVLTPVTLGRADLRYWKQQSADRSAYGSVRGRHRNLQSGHEEYETSGSGDPVHTLRHVHSTAALAGRAAASKFKHLQQSSSKVSIEPVIGRPDLWAGRPIVLAGLRDGINGPWVCADVDHDINWSAGGFKTTVEATISGKDEEPAGGGGE